MTVQNLKLRVPVNFPARVIGATGISANKSGGVWTIKNDFSVISNLPSQFIDNPSNKQLLIFDPASGEYNTVTLSGLSEALYTLTSTTSLAIATGSTTFTVQAGKDVAVGDWLLITSDADPTTDYMVGQITSYSNATLVVDVTATSGSGTHADWTLRRTSPTAGVLLANNNLSDLQSATTARTNLGLGDSATKDVGTTTGTVAAGDDSRITGAAQKSSNLSDLANVTTARTNLGLGNSATKDVGTTTGTVAAGDDSRIIGAIANKSLLGNVSGGSQVAAQILQSQMRDLLLPAMTVYNLETEFGADANATDNTLALNNALGALVTAGGGLLYVPNKQFKFASAVSITDPRIWIVGAGEQSDLRYTGSGIGLSIFGGIESVTLADLKLSAAVSTAQILQLSHFTQSFFSRNVYYDGGGVQVELTSGLTNNGAFDIHFIGGRSRNAGTRFLYVNPADATLGLDQAVYVSHMAADGFAQFFKCVGHGTGVFMNNLRVERHISATASPFDIDYTSKCVIRDIYGEDDANVPFFTLGANAHGVSLRDVFVSFNTAGGTNTSACALTTNNHFLFGLTLDGVTASWGGTVTNVFNMGQSPFVATNTYFIGGTATYGFAGTAATNDTNILNDLASASTTFSTAKRQVTGRFAP